METHYSEEKNIQILIALLKQYGIKKVVVSPGSTNLSFVISLQTDPFFELYSVVDERSAAYVACGLAEESKEPVVLSCTGATAHRNYMSGLTEAYYRKLPILAITSTVDISKVGHHLAQVTDRQVFPNDTINFSVHVQVVKDADDWWDCEIKLNKALLELKRRGGGPVHINLTTSTFMRGLYNTKTLPKVRVINRFFSHSDNLPTLPKGKIAVFVGSHTRMSESQIEAIERFCAANDAVVLCDHTSGYSGKYCVIHSLSSSQSSTDFADLRPYLTIHIGEISGDFTASRRIVNQGIIGNEIWRVSEDGEIRDTFRKLTNVFEMSEQTFFNYYAQNSNNKNNSSYLEAWNNHLDKLNEEIPELPFSNIWIAEKIHDLIPENSTIHFGILTSLRSWNLFRLPKTVQAASNVGGFGIDGCMSTLIGSSLVNDDKLYFGVVGDLAFFYDINSLGIRHIGNNVRILMVNNGTGSEFRHFTNPGALLGEAVDDYVSAAGHFGQQSRTLVKNYAENLGFEYMSASDKDEFEQVYEKFITPNKIEKPVVFEVFTECENDTKALELVSSIRANVIGKTIGITKDVLGPANYEKLVSKVTRMFTDRT